MKEETIQNTEINKSKNESKEIKFKKDKDEAQVTISLDSERKLKQLLERVNNNFEFGKITRKQLLDHVIEQATLDFTDDNIQAVRQSCITDLMLFEKQFRVAKKTGVVPDALREYLWKSSDLTHSPKRNKKTRLEKYNNDIHENEGAT